MKKVIFTLILSANCALGATLELSTFLGASSNDFGYDISVSQNGSIFVVGMSNSTNFPTTVGAFDNSQNGDKDAFVLKLSSDGSNLIYSTFLGGTSNDQSWGIDVDDFGNSFLTGITQSNNFPMQNAYNNFLNGDSDVFVSKLSVNGDSLIYSTFLGGISYDYATEIKVDASGNILLTGFNYSFNFPIQNAYDFSFNGSADAFITKLSPDGSSLIFSTFLGGTTNDFSNGIAIDENKNVYVTGYTNSTDFPVSPSSLSSIFNGGNWDAFVSKISQNGSVLSYSTFLGGTNSDTGNAVTLNKNGNAFVTGTTSSTNFPTKNAFQDSLEGGFDIFVSGISANADSLIYSTFFGGSLTEKGYGIAIDNNGILFVSGYTESYNFPTFNAYDDSINGSSDLFLTKLNPFENHLEFSTFIGGIGDERQSEVGNPIFYKSGNVYLTASVESMNFPTTNGAFSQSFGGGISEASAIKVSIPISRVKIKVSGNDSILSWDKIDSVNLYKIYRSDTPDFSNSIQIGTLLPNVNSPVFTDFGASQNSEKKYYFVTWEN